MMAAKRNDKESGHRVKALEKEIAEYKQTEKIMRESQETNWSLIDLSPDPIVVSQDGHLKMVNSAFKALFGLSQQDLDQGMDIFDFIQEPDKEMVRKRYQDRISGKDFPKRISMDLVAGGGKIIPCEASSNAIQFHGRPALLVIVRDVSERKQTENALRKAHDELEEKVTERTRALLKANEGLNREIDERKAVEKALRESEERYRLLFEHSGALIQVFDNNGICRMINKVAASYYEGSPDDFAGKSFHALRLKEADEYEKRIRRIFDSGEGEVTDEFIVLPSGNGGWFLSNAQPVRDATGNIISVQIISQDITEIRRIETALRKSEENFRDLVETINDVIWEVDSNGRYTYLSPRIHDVVGYHPEELLGEPFFTRMAPDEARRVSAIFSDFLAQPKSFSSLETTPLHKNGKKVVFENSGKPFFSPDGALLGYRGVNRDITQRKKAEIALRESEEEYRNLFNSIPDPVVIVQNDLSILFNQAFTALFGYDGHNLEKDISPFSLIKKDDDRETAKNRMSNRLAGEKVVPEFHCVDLICKEGNTIPCEVKGTLIQFKGSPADLVIFRDISEHKRVEKIIRNLSHELIKSQENERRIISRELHDHVAQDISVSRIAAEMLLKDNGLTPQVRKQVSEISESLRTTLMVLRDLAYDLRPPGLDHLGLTKTVHQHCRDFSKKTGIHIDFKAAGIDGLDLDFEAKINIYRLVQECLNNIRKHADASKAMVRMIASFPNILLRVEDDGKGFDVDKRMVTASKEKRMGLQNMQERTSLLQGEFSIQSGPGTGTKILVKLPCMDNSIG